MIQCLVTVLLLSCGLGPDLAFAQSCKDVLHNCKDYGVSACHGIYEPWARINCASTCGYCLTTTTKSVPTLCVDMLDECEKYLPEGCNFPYQQWAMKNCMATCNLCKTPEPTTTTSMPTVCADKLENCQEYGREACDPPYREWAMEHCPHTCQICDPSLHPTGECEDETDNCTTHGPQMCTRRWGIDNCPLTCGYCPQSCKDELYNCKQYGTSACLGEYEPWARNHCASFCGYCYNSQTISTTPATPAKNLSDACKDKLDNCKDYGKSVCDIHLPWSRVNCAAFCGICQTNSTQTTVNPVTTTTNEVQKLSCYYKGDYYRTGETWTDTNGCVLDCTCINGKINYYACKYRCPEFKNVPSNCTVYQTPGQCCSALDCGGKDIQGHCDVADQWSHIKSHFW